MKFLQATTLILTLCVHSLLAAPAPLEKDRINTTIRTVTRFDFIAYRKIEANTPSTCGKTYLDIPSCRADCTPTADTCGYCVFRSCGFGADQYECVCGPKPNARCEFYIEPPIIEEGALGGFRPSDKEEEGQKQ